MADEKTQSGATADQQAAEAAADEVLAATGAAEAPAGNEADELARAQDRVLRLQAELDNVYKRSRRELDDRLRYANFDLVQQLLPVIDNIERAIEAAGSGETSGLLEGVQLVAQQLQAVLATHHCTPIEALHQPFDPNLHEAISQQPSDEYPPGTVILVTQTGYQLHDRVVRPPQVIIASAPSNANE